MRFWGYFGDIAPEGDTSCPGPICTIMQNFTPIGVTADEISIGAQKNKADLISDKNAALRLSIINPLRCRGNYSATSINMKSVHCMADLLAIPNPSTASVLSPYCYIIVRCYAVLMPIKRLNEWKANYSAISVKSQKRMTKKLDHG